MLVSFTMSFLIFQECRRRAVIEVPGGGPTYLLCVQVSAVLEASVLLLYLGGLLVLLAFGTFLVVRQVLVRRELENAAKELQVSACTSARSSPLPQHTSTLVAFRILHSS